jgi:hypothetical protein
VAHIFLAFLQPYDEVQSNSAIQASVSTESVCQQWPQNENWKKTPLVNLWFLTKTQNQVLRLVILKMNHKNENKNNNNNQPQQNNNHKERQVVEDY